MKQERTQDAPAVREHANPAPKYTTFIAVLIVMALLYFAREVFIPFSLALLFSFLLAPLVVRLRRWHLGRIPSVLIVVSLAFTIIAIVGGLVSLQLTDLGHQLPQYRENITHKLHSIHASSSGVINRISRAVHDFTEELNPPSNAPGEEKPVPVEIRKSPFSPLDVIRNVLGSAINVLITAAVVVVFVIFMLFQHEDLRDRLIRLFGARQLNLTTKAFDEAGYRVSRYLLAQLALNTIFGVLAGIGLYFMRVPNPILWAVLAAVLRYVPYLGIWVAASMPAAIAFAISPGWFKPIGIFGLYFGIDLLNYNFAEPLLYGRSAGISPMGILVAAVFWTWLWGPIGLLLSTPLTVCLIVMGRYVPSLEFLDVLLSDHAVLSPEKRLYQRLLATDVDEALEIAEEFLKGKSLERLYDEVIIPALSLAEEDRHRGKLDENQQQFVFENARLLVEDIGERADELIAGNNGIKNGLSHRQQPVPRPEQPPTEACILTMPARDEADEIAGVMLAQLLNRRGMGAKSVSAAALASERIEEAARSSVNTVCVTAIPPLGQLPARYLCKRLRAQFPHVRIVAVVLTRTEAQQLRKHEAPMVADQTVTSLASAVAELVSIHAAAPERPR